LKQSEDSKLEGMTAVAQKCSLAMSTFPGRPKVSEFGNELEKM
jgi:hypothetical protein